MSETDGESKVNRYNHKKKAKAKSRINPMLNVIAASLVVILASVIAVRAYLSAETEKLKNTFAAKEMTYTDTVIAEPGGSTYSIQIDNSTHLGTLKSSGNDKSACVHNSAGDDKKPVFVRVTMVMNIYDSSGVNVTREYPNCQPSYNHTDPEGTPTEDLWVNNWVIDTAVQPNCYYYSHILLPDHDTRKVFDSVTVTNANLLPENAKVKIRVMTDTVQAVATDDMNWTASDYTGLEMLKAWNRVSSVSIDNTGLTTQVSAPVEWVFKNS